MANVFDDFLGNVTDKKKPEENAEHLPINLIKVDPNQPRKYFDETAQKSLIESISQYGVLQPILVRPADNNYVIVAGERRYRAAKTAKLKEIPAKVVDITEKQAFELSLIENLQRQDLDPVEETDSVLRLLSLRLSVSHDDAVTLLKELDKAEKGRRHNIMPDDKEVVYNTFTTLGLNLRSFVNNRLPLLFLPEDILEFVRKGKLQYTKAKEIAKIADFDKRQSLLENVAEEDLSFEEVRQKVSLILEKVADEESVDLKLIKGVKRRLNNSTLNKLPPKKLTKVRGLLKELEQLLLESDD